MSRRQCRTRLAGRRCEFPFGPMAQRAAVGHSRLPLPPGVPMNMSPTPSVTPGARRALSAAMAFALALLAACASTQLKDTWKDPGFAGPPMHKLLVVGALTAAKTGAEVSYHELPESGEIPNERVQAAVRNTGSDGVLVTRLMRVRRD